MKTRYLICASAIALYAMPSAAAQTAPAGAPAAQPAAYTPPQDDTAADIVVTAQKRVERVQDIPKQVDVVAVEDLQSAGVTQLRELTNISASVTGSANQIGTPAIRGVSSFAFSIGVQAQTGIVLDDIPQPSFSTLANELSDVERVEVLAGPQSTLSGRNAAGGLINIVTRSPSKTVTGDATIEFTDDHQFRLTGFLSGPITDTLAVSLSGYRNYWRGPGENLRTGQGFGGYDTFGFRGKLRWEPSSSFTAQLSGYYQETKSLVIPNGGGVIVRSEGGNLFGQTPQRLFPRITIGPRNRDIDVANLRVVRSRNRGADLRLEIDLGGPTLTSITSYSLYSLPTEDYFAVLPQAFSSNAYDVDYKTQEFRLTSAPGSRIQYLLGAVYYDTKTSFPYYRVGFAPLDRYLESTVKNLAVFGRGTFELGGGNFLIGGLRYGHDKYNYEGVITPIAGGATTRTANSGGETYDFVAGEASFRHEFDRNTNVYVTLARGNTGKAYDLEDLASLQAGTLRPLTAETVNNIEVGVKSQSADRRWTLNVNGFFAKYNNYQVQSLQVVDVNTLPVIRLFSIGKVEIKGVEFQGGFRPDDRLSLSLNAIYLDAKIRDYPSADCYRFQTAAQGCDPVTNRQANIAGLTMPNSPKFKAIATVDYKLPLPSLPFDASVGAFYRWQSRARFDLFGDPTLYQDAYGVFNVKAAIRDRSDRWGVELFVNNVFNNGYYATLSNDVFWSRPNYAATYNRDSFRYGGIRANVRF